jgi:dTDP-4-amino-4,6-dideoxygalactose transaminase
MIPLFAVFMPNEVDEPLLKVLHSGYIGQGTQVEKFEGELKRYFKHDKLLTLNSGTSGLHLALRLAGVQPGDDVITTPVTCTATNMPIVGNGAKIVWADVDPQTGLIDPEDVAKKINTRTRAIVCVDWGGTPCDLNALRNIAKAYGIKLIEDAAHSIGAVYDGSKVGTIADYTSFSLQAIKHITTVDGGILSVLTELDYKRGKLIRWYGIDRETERTANRCEDPVQEWGYKFHMNDINATIGLAQIPHLPHVLRYHRENAWYYNWHLDPYFLKPCRHERLGYSAQSAYWLYTMLLPTKEARVNFMDWMKQNDVQVSQVHARNDIHPAFQENLSPRTKDTPLPGVEEFYDRAVCIPVHWKLTIDEREFIVSLCNEFVKGV